MLLFDPYYGHDNVENARVKERTMLKKNPQYQDRRM